MKTTQWSRQFAILMMSLISLAASAQAVKATTVTLQVVDPTGAPIPHASLRIVPRPWNPNLPRPKTAADGTVRIELVPGSYEVFVYAPNFRRARQKFEVANTANQTVRIRLEVGSSSGPEVTAGPEMTGATSREAESIWKLENELWKAAQQNDSAAYKAFWQADCVSWHDHEFASYGPENAAAWMLHKRNGLHLEEFMLHPDAIKIVGSTAMVFITATELWVNDESRGEPTSTRYAHYWVKTAQTWKLAGEMSADEK